MPRAAVYRRRHNPHDPKSDEMNLPPGLTCGDCVHIPRCEAIYGHIPADEVCDWWPSRFLLKETP